MTTARRPGLIGVVGGAGLVGSRVVQDLVQQGIPVVAIVRNALSAAVLEALIHGVNVRIGSVDLPDAAAVTLDAADTVINCAIAGSGGIPRNAYTRNRDIVDGILSVPGVRRLIHFSSVAVYGEIFSGISEDAGQFAAPHPTSEYGRSKLNVEQYARARCAERDVDCTVVRLGHVYGPEVARSREILSLIGMRDFHLPFDGRYPSNAAHLARIGEAITALTQAEDAPAVTNLWEPSLSWRDLFDWHAAAIGADCARGLDEASSRRVQRSMLDRSVRSTTTRWMRSLPVSELVRSPAIFDRVLMILARTPTGVTQRARTLGRKLKGGPLVSPGASIAAGLPVLYCSEGAPGPTLPMPALDEGAAFDLRTQLHDWYEGITRPPFAAR
jgi:UDP-glucuronate 4-epimerase